MGTLLRMAGLRDLRRDDGLSDVSATVLGDGMNELTLEYQLRQLNERHMEYAAGLHAKIEQLERELAEYKDVVAWHEIQLAAEKALSDAFYPEANQRYIAQDACASYRKARGME